VARSELSLIQSFRLQIRIASLFFICVGVLSGCVFRLRQLRVEANKKAPSSEEEGASSARRRETRGAFPHSFKLQHRAP
jgi:hypothetical protein